MMSTNFDLDVNQRHKTNSEGNWKYRWCENFEGLETGGVLISSLADENYWEKGCYNVNEF